MIESSCEGTEERFMPTEDDAGSASAVTVKIISDSDSQPKKRKAKKLKFDENGRPIQPYCEHKKHRSQCAKCGGSNICPHKRQKSKCFDCGGTKNDFFPLGVNDT
jgi:hypothetical protein